MASAGDVDGDGLDDVLIGAPHNDAGGEGAGRAYVYSVVSGARLLTLTGQSLSSFGWSVAAAGDRDADGFDDVFVGATRVGSGGVRGGVVYLYSGQTGRGSPPMGRCSSAPPRSFEPVASEYPPESAAWTSS